MDKEQALCDARVERVGSRDRAIFTYKNLVSGASERREGLCVPEYTDGVQLFLSAVTDAAKGVIRDIGEVEAVGFKTVFAPGFLGDHELTDAAMAALEEGVRVAPAHNIPYIETINVFKRLLPAARMVGAFETDFHRTVPLERQIYSVPYEWYEKYGVRRYGYHGRFPRLRGRPRSRSHRGAARRVISCHLGGSGSLCAILDGRSVDSTCGFSLQSGLPHSSRAGDIDPYIFPFLLGEGLTAEEITRGITKNGGLLGVSGLSGDMRDLEAAIARGQRARPIGGGDVSARHRLRRRPRSTPRSAASTRWSLPAASARIPLWCAPASARRSRIWARGWTRRKNGPAEGERVISRDDSPAQVWVIPANEELNVARRALALLKKG